jgi:hypothetical protein
MERIGTDRRPGTKVRVKKATPAFRFGHLASSGRVNESLLYSSSVVFAAIIAMAVLYNFDSYYFDGFYVSAVWKVLQQIRDSFHF